VPVLTRLGIADLIGKMAIRTTLILRYPISRSCLQWLCEFDKDSPLPIWLVACDSELAIKSPLIPDLSSEMGALVFETWGYGGSKPPYRALPARFPPV